ncbi:MAG: histidinol-phosphate aminotransferase family protein [Alloprevotella sp.]|nr:histidinol-phosphate aminotransferase family protein [Alloprevotella sp.]
MKPLKELVRPNIQALLAACEDGREALPDDALRLDRGESPYNTPLNRYPDATQRELRQELSRLKGIRPDCLFPLSGTAEALDLLIRVFCSPGRDNIVCLTPARPLVWRAAKVNDVEVRAHALDDKGAFSAAEVLRMCNANTKLVVLSAPNALTGCQPAREEILALAAAFPGIVVVDEAYADFSASKSVLYELGTYNNLVVLQTFSKAWACAGIRLGTVLAVPSVVRLLEAVSSTVAPSLLTQREAVQMLRRRYDVETWVKHIVEERDKVVRALRQLPAYEAEFPSEANFVLVRLKDAARIHSYLRAQGIVTDDCKGTPYYPDCLRITIGLPHENNRLLAALRQYS